MFSSCPQLAVDYFDGLSTFKICLAVDVVCVTSGSHERRATSIARQATISVSIPSGVCTTAS
jgi:hypothetical protein